MAYPTFQAAVQCPNCGQHTTMAIEQVIDVGEEPSKRERLLRGRINVMRCERCAATGPIAVPMIYHDPNHDMLLAFIPPEMHLAHEQEEKEVGRLTNLVLDNTPAEKRRGYLLNPTRVMSFDSLVEKIMEAEGVSPDDLRKQTQKIQLVMKMAQVAHEDEKLKALIQEHRETIDYNFMVLVTVTLQQAAEVHDEPTVERYNALREKLIKELDLKADQVPSMGVEPSMDDLIDTLLTTPAIMLQGTVASNRPLLDYNFFLRLSQRAEESGDEQEKARLLTLRSRLVELTEEMDRLAREAMERAAQQLNAVLQAEDINAKIQELYEELDEAFLVVLSANVEQARSQKREDIVELLMRIYSRVVEVMEERLRPELRAMNVLLRTDDPTERQARLRQEMQIYNPAGFIEMIEVIADDLEQSGSALPSILERLYTLADEARAIAATLDGTFTPPIQKLFGDGPDAPGIILP